MKPRALTKASSSAKRRAWVAEEGCGSASQDPTRPRGHTWSTGLVMWGEARCEGHVPPLRISGIMVCWGSGVCAHNRQEDL